MKDSKAFPSEDNDSFYYGMTYRQYLAGEVAKGLLSGNMCEQMGATSSDLMAKDVRTITDAIIKQLEDTR